MGSTAHGMALPDPSIICAETVACASKKITKLVPARSVKPQQMCIPVYECDAEGCYARNY